MIKNVFHLPLFNLLMSGKASIFIPFLPLEKILFSNFAHE